MAKRDGDCTIIINTFQLQCEKKSKFFYLRKINCKNQLWNINFEMWNKEMHLNMKLKK